MNHSTLDIIKYSFSEIEKENTCKILIIDNSEDYRSEYSLLLNKQGLDVANADCGFKAIETLTFFPADIVFINCHLHDLDSFKCCEYILKIDPRISVIFTSPFSSSELKILVFKAGGKDVIEKPFSNNILKDTVKKHLTKKSSEHNLEY